MAEYHVSGRSAEGRQVIKRIEATSAAEAVKILEEQHFTDIVLHSNDIEISVRRQMEALHGGKNTDRIFTPREFVKLRRDSSYPALLLLTIPKAFELGWWSIVLIVALVAFRRFQAQPFDSVDLHLIAALVVPVVWLSLVFLFGNSAKYRRVVEARARGRWQEVLTLLPSIAGRIPADQIAHFKAMALAALGRLDEALEGFEQYGDGKHLPLWRYWGNLAGVFAAGKDGEGAVLAMEKAAELRPTEPVVLVDFATSLIRRRRDPRRARQVLDQALKYPITDVIAYGVDLCRGLIALDENQPYEALENLNRALARVLEYRNASPLMGAAGDRIHACLALANAAVGEYETALRHFQIARPRLAALRYDDDLLERCEKALGLTADWSSADGD